MLDLELYLVKFDPKANIKDKLYPNNCQMRGIGCRFVIAITYDKCIFSTNDRETHGGQYKRDIFFCFKKKERRIIVSDFLLLFS